MKNSLSSKTLISFLFEAASNKNNGITFIQGVNDESFLSYEQLLQKAKYCLYKLQANGIRKSDELILQIEDNKEFLIVFWACLLGGIIPVPISVGNRNDFHLKVANVWNKLNNPYFIASRQVFKDFDGFLLEEQRIDLKASISAKHIFIDEVMHGTRAGDTILIDNQDLAYIQFSSGSTGQPKGVTLTHNNLVVNALDIVERSATSLNDTMLSWMPLTHDMGMICFHLSGVVAGIKQCLMPPSLFVRRPLLWMEKAHQHHATQLYSPNFGFDYFLSSFTKISKPNWDLSRIRIIYNGAEPISYPLCISFSNSLRVVGLRSNVMFPGYGLAEASVAVALPNVGEELKSYKLSRNHLSIGDKVLVEDNNNTVEFVECGYPVKHCEVRIATLKGTPCPDFTIGEIHIKGANVTKSYYNDKEATDQIITKDGWLKTGDLGFLVNKKLVITGRLKNLIIINGQNFYPQDIENSLKETLDHVKFGKVAACGVQVAGSNSQELVIFFQFKGKIEFFASSIVRIQKLLQEHFGLVAKAIIPIQRIPRTTSGKVRYFAMVSDYLEGKFDKVIENLEHLNLVETGKGSVPKNDLKPSLKKIWRKCFPNRKIELSGGLFESGVNSLMAMHFIQLIKSELHIELTFTEIYAVTSFQELLQLVSTKHRVQKSTAFTKWGNNVEISLTDLQKRFWFIHEYDRNALNLKTCIRFKNEKIHLDLLQRSVQKIVSQQEIVRTVFSDKDGIPFQVILPPEEATFKLDHLDFSNTANQEEAAEIFINSYVREPFDLNKWPLFKMAVLKLSDEDFYLIFVIHHIIFDGTSVGIFINKLKEFYYGDLSVENQQVVRDVQFKDYVAWVQQQYTINPQTVYWKNKLANGKNQISLFQKNSKSTNEFQAGLHKIKFSSQLYHDISRFCDQQNVTLFAVLCASLRLLLVKLTGLKSFVIGTDADARMHPDLTSALGPFLNTIPLIVSINENLSFIKLVKLEQENLLEAFDHQPFNYTELVDNYKEADSISTSLFNVLILLQNMESNFDFRRLFKKADASHFKFEEFTLLTDLEFEYILDEHALSLNLKYNLNAFSFKEAESIGNQIIALLENLLLNADKEVRSVALINAEEKIRIQSFEKGVSTTIEGSDFFTLIEQHGCLSPESIALIFEETRISYKDLSEQINSVAYNLTETLGVQKQEIVALIVERDEKMIVLILALLKMNIAILPIDPDFPVNRIHMIIKDSQPNHILVSDQLVNEISLSTNSAIIYSSQIFATNTSSKNKFEMENIEYGDHDLAYILYTSGTTGTPKGVMIDRCALWDYTCTFKDLFKLSSKDKIVQQSSLSFDVWIEEVFPILASGGTMVILKEGGKNIEDLVLKVEQHNVSIISTTPLVINELNKNSKKLSHLRLLISGGESLKASYIDNLIEHIDIYNTYGPTETTVCVTTKKITSINDLDNLGKPLPNHNIQIVDNNLQSVGIGIEGEIIISGKGIATGYLNNPAITYEKFISRNDHLGKPYYRTGDLGKWTENGEIIFRGRLDNQIKWRGYRIEPEEIEKVILSVANVNEAVVAVKEIEKDYYNLVAYLIADSKIEEQELYAALSKHLPAYQIPNKLIQVAKFPMTIHGKIDINALPVEASSLKSKDSYGSSNKIESNLLSIWKELFDNKELSIVDNFFSLGGQSIIAARMASRIKAKLGIKPTFKQIFSNPTIQSLAASLETQNLEATLTSLKSNDNSEFNRLSIGQNRLWILDQLETDKTPYNLSWKFELVNNNWISHFESAMKMLVERHESLRTVFSIIDGTPTQEIKGYKDTSLNIKKWELPEVGDLDLDTLIQEWTNIRFDLENGPLYAINSVIRPGEKVLIIFTLHHIIADGWSMEILLKELNYVIACLINNQHITLPEINFHYRDFANWQNENVNLDDLIKQKTFWNHQFAEDIENLSFGVNAQTGDSEFANAKTVRFTFSKKLVEELNRIATNYNATLFIVFHGILNLLLFKLSGKCDVTTCTPHANRFNKLFEPIVGYFLDLLPIRLKFKADFTFEELVEKLHTTTFEAYDHQSYPSDWLFNDLKKHSDINANRLFNILVVMQNFEGVTRFKNATGKDQFLTNIEEIDNKYAISDLLFEFNQFKENWEFKIRYNTSRFSSTLIESLGERFELLGQQIISNVHLKLHEYDVVLPTERWLIPQFSMGSKKIYSENNVIELFKGQVLNNPNAIAIYDDSKTLTYAELNRSVDQLTNYINSFKSYNQKKRIALIGQRNEDTIIMLLAILQSGNAFVPIEMSYPEIRKKSIIEDAEVAMVLTDCEVLFELPEGVEIINIEQQASKIQSFKHVETPDNELIQKGSEAYVMFTSGSSGKPKGVSISHTSMMDYVHTFIDYFKVDKNDKVIQQSSLSFDVSIEEIFPALCTGASLILFPKGAEHVMDLINAINRYEATILSTTPLVIEAINERAVKLKTLRLLVSGGELLKPKQIDKLYGEIAIYNTYGPTETTVCATFHAVENLESASLLGKPITNHAIYLLDQYNNLVPPGIPGEIHIAGNGLANGYINSSEENINSFITLTTINADRLYKTGDLGMWSENGVLSFVGRLDKQTKLNGYRVEPLEIQQTLLYHENVHNALVLPHDNFLVAYVTGSQSLNEPEIKSFLIERFPHFMIPRKICILERMPTNSNGKLDTSKLPSINSLLNKVKQREKLPLNEVEKSLLACWEKVLNTKVDSLEDDFFALGGNSIKAVNLVIEIEKSLNISLNLSDIFNYSTIISQKGCIERSPRIQKVKPLDVNPQGVYPVSNVQKRLWILNQFENEKSAYNIVLTSEIDGDLNKARLEGCLQQLVKRHESLRTVFGIKQGELQQTIVDTTHFHFLLEYKNLKDNTPPMQREMVLDIVSKEQLRHFNLSTGPLFICKLLALEVSKHVLIINLHHIIADGWSVNVLMQEIKTLYENDGNVAVLPNLEFQYKDFINTTLHQTSSSSYEKSKQFWNHVFKNEIPKINLPTDFKRPAIRTGNGNSIEVQISENLANQLNTLCKSNDISLFVLMLGSFKLLLNKYTQQKEIVIGVPILGRDQPAMANQIGCYVNTMALYTQIDDSQSLLSLFNSTKKQLYDAMQHQSYHFDQLVEDLNIEKDLSRSPIFDVMIVMHNNQLVNTQQKSEELTITPLSFPIKTTKYDLVLNVFDDPSGVKLIVEFNTDLFLASTIERIFENFVFMLANTKENAALGLRSIDIINEKEKELISKRLTKHQNDVVNYKHVVDRFKAIVAAQTHASAVLTDKGEYSYGFLNDLSNQIANQLVTKHLIKRGQPVGIMANRNVEMIASIIATLQIGAIYVPIDPSYPSERINYILEDAAVHLVITEKAFVSKLEGSTKSLLLDQLTSNQSVAESADTGLDLEENNLSHIIYTSGSTGDPKGVAISNGSLSQLIEWSIREFENDKINLVYALTSCSFDLSLFEIFYPLCAGKSIRLLNSALDIDQIIKKDQDVLINTVPSVVNYLIEINADLSGVNALNMAGEMIPLSIKKALSNSNIKIRNLYGPSEDTTYSTCYTFDQNHETIPIGKPISGTSILIVNDDLQLVPFGVFGQIAIAGKGLALGYLNRPQLTEKKFLEHPLNSDERIYMTGDYGRWLTDGNLEFHGRIDDQIKLRGHRIELGEIENAIYQIDGIQKCIILLDVHNNEKQIVAYLTVEKDLDEVKIKKRLWEKLPTFMIPQIFVILDKFPLTPNGKIDKKKLTISEYKQATPVMDHPIQEANNEALKSIWENFTTTAFNYHDSFFEVGGHSLKAMQLANAMNDKFNLTIGLKEIFANPKFAQQLSLISSYDHSTNKRIKVVEDQDYHSVSFGQERMWVMANLEPNNPSYNMQACYIIKGQIDINLLNKAYQLLFERYEILRTYFNIIDGQPKQVILPIGHFANIKEHKLGSNSAQNISLAIKLASDQALIPIKLNDWPLLKLDLYRLDESNFVFSIIMHHIISDAWSMKLIFNEIVRNYTMLTTKSLLKSKPLSFQFKDFSNWQTKSVDDRLHQQSEIYWKTQMFKPIPCLNIKSSFPRPTIKSNSGAKISFVIDNKTTSDIRHLALEHNVSVFIALLAVTKLNLSLHSDQSDIIVGVPLAGRENIETENQIGFFVNTVPIRTRFLKSDNFSQLLTAINLSVTNAVSHQNYSIHEMVDSIKLSRQLDRSPLFDVLINYDNQTISSEAEIAGIEIQEAEEVNVLAKYDLTFLFVEQSDQIFVEIVYNSDIFPVATIKSLEEGILALTNQIIVNPKRRIKELNIGYPKNNLKVGSEDRNDMAKEAADIIQQLEYRVSKHPDALAIIDEDVELTYKELNESSNKVAWHILRQAKHKQNPFVVTLMDKSWMAIVSIIGVLKAGCAYLPVDPTQPINRINHILKDSLSELVLTSRHALSGLKISGLQVIEDILENEPKHNNPQISLAFNQPCYAIYTSGTTGNPKGVVVNHGALNNLSHWLKDLIYGKYDRNLKVLLNAPLTFDSSIKQLFPPLLSGASIVLVTEKNQKDPVQFVKMLKDYKVDVFDATPSFLNVLLRFVKNDNLKINFVLVGGEPISHMLIQKFYEIFGEQSKLVNVYGLTEATVDSTYNVIKYNNQIDDSIGFPIPNTDVYILNDLLQPVEDGTIGEIFIGGIGLASGYLNQPELTSEKFIFHDVIQKRLLATGDLGIILPSGKIQIKGRSDSQVKIRGFRIELLEIKNVLERLDQVRQAAVIKAEDSTNESVIVAYIQFNGEELSAKQIRDLLSSSLPDYMLPSFVIAVANFHLTKHGKIDVDKLPTVDFKDSSPTISNEEFKSEVEKQLTDLWQQVLGTKNISRTDSFFDIGGNSLKVINLFEKIEEIYPGTIEIHQIFSNPKLKDLALLLDNNQQEELENINVLDL